MSKLGSMRYLLLGAGTLALALSVGCSKPAGQEAPQGGQADGPRAAGPRAAGPRGGVKLAADASGQDVFRQMCVGCHGRDGAGARGPSLQHESGDPDTKIEKIVHDGKGRMPAFGSRLSDAQIAKVTTYVKQLTPSKGA